MGGCDSQLVANVLEADVNESYLGYLVALRTKLAFCSGDALVKKAAALQDVEPELEKLRVKATARVRDFMLQVRVAEYTHTVLM
jgi:hypothetical protein